jgi:hypothetical protein
MHAIEGLYRPRHNYGLRQEVPGSKSHLQSAPGARKVQGSSNHTAAVKAATVLTS